MRPFYRRRSEKKRGGPRTKIAGYAASVDHKRSCEGRFARFVPNGTRYNNPYPLGTVQIFTIFCASIPDTIFFSPSTHSHFTFTDDTPPHRIKRTVPGISRCLAWRCENFTQFHCHTMITPSYGERISPDGARLLVLVGNDFCIRDGARRRNAKVFRNPLRWT